MAPGEDRYIQALEALSVREDGAFVERVIGDYRICFNFGHSAVRASKGERVPPRCGFVKIDATNEGVARLLEGTKGITLNAKRAETFFASCGLPHLYRRNKAVQ